MARREDLALLRGEGRFVADLRLPGLLHLAVVRSPYSHGTLLRVDLDAARTTPGVVDAFAATDLDTVPRLPSRLPVPARLDALLQPVLADAEVRYAGQPVAVVVGQSAQAAQDGGDAAIVDVDPLPPPREKVHEEAVGVGDVERAFDRAALVVEEHFSVDRAAGVPLETRGLIAVYDADAHTLALHAAAKAPQHMRAVVAAAVGLPETSVELHPVDAGGGFGVRGELHPEDLLAAIAAVRSGAAIRFVEGRSEHFHAAYQSRGQEWHARLALGADGTILALDASVRVDLGAFCGPNGVTPARVALRALPGPYRVAAYRCRAELVRTCKPPQGTTRGPGHVEAAFVRERLLDLAAAKLGTTPADLRRRNLVTPAEMPYDTGLERVVLDGGDYAEPLARVESALAAAHPAGGVGLACVVEASGSPGVEHVDARAEASGRFTFAVGSSSLGQGHATAFAHIAGEVLGVDAALVDVREGTTQGGGTFASRTTVMAGSAVHAAAVALREALATSAPPVDARGTFESTAATFTYGAAGAVVDVDAETGTVDLRRLVVVVDAGVAIDLEGARGQLLGSAAHGAGIALSERLAFDDADYPLATNLRDYHLPLALDLPNLEAIVLELVRSPGNPLGVRGVGEIAVSGAAAAIANAVAAALNGRATVTALPILPERLVATVPA